MSAFKQTNRGQNAWQDPSTAQPGFDVYKASAPPQQSQSPQQSSRQPNMSAYGQPSFRRDETVYSPFGNFQNLGQYQQQQDAFVQQFLQSQNQYNQGLNQGQNMAPVQLGDAWRQAGENIANGTYQGNPFATGNVQALMGMFDQYGIPAPAGFQDQLIGMIGQQSPPSMYQPPVPNPTAPGSPMPEVIRDGGNQRYQWALNNPDAPGAAAILQNGTAWGEGYNIQPMPPPPGPMGDYGRPGQQTPAPGLVPFVFGEGSLSPETRYVTPQQAENLRQRESMTPTDRERMAEMIQGIQGMFSPQPPAPPTPSLVDQFRQSQEFKDWENSGSPSNLRIGIASDGTRFTTATESKMYDNWLKSQRGGTSTPMTGFPIGPQGEYWPGGTPYFDERTGQSVVGPVSDWGFQPFIEPQQTPSQRQRAAELQRQAEEGVNRIRYEQPPSRVRPVGAASEAPERSQGTTYTPPSESSTRPAANSREETVQRAREFMATLERQKQEARAAREEENRRGAEAYRIEREQREQRRRETQERLRQAVAGTLEERPNVRPVGSAYPTPSPSYGTPYSPPAVAEQPKPLPAALGSSGPGWRESGGVRRYDPYTDPTGTGAVGAMGPNHVAPGWKVSPITGQLLYDPYTDPVATGGKPAYSPSVPEGRTWGPGTPRSKSVSREPGRTQGRARSRIVGF